MTVLCNTFTHISATHENEFCSPSMSATAGHSQNSKPVYLLVSTAEELMMH